MDYIKNITRKLKKKRNATLRKAFNKGIQQSQEECCKLNTAIHRGLERAHELKIQSIIISVQKLIEQHLQEDSTSIINIAKKALKNISEHTDAELSAHPIDAAILAHAASALNISNAASRTVTIIKDETLERGSLVIKAHKSIIDARVSTQLNRARDVLLA
jgi:flagellar biosynthesis/type III secretory pathway protein FliH